MMAAFFPSTAPIWRISVANKRLKTQTSLANRHMYIYKFIQHMSVQCKCKQTKQAASYLVMPCYAMPCCAAPSMVIILRQSGVFINLSYAAIVQSTRRRRRKRGRSMSSKSQQQQCWTSLLLAVNNANAYAWSEMTTTHMCEQLAKKEMQAQSVVATCALVGNC